MARILMVLTSHTRLGGTGRATGFYFEELAAPYYAFVDAGHEVDIASIAGGKAAHDPSSLEEEEAQRPDSVRRFLSDTVAMARLSRTLKIDAVDPAAYAAIFLPGGHGVMWDFPNNAALSQAVSRIFNAGGVVGAVCHGPAGLVDAQRADGKPLVSGLKVNSFTNAEEEAVALTKEVPFLLETRLRDLGGVFEAGENFTPKAVRDGRLVTGQNPMSSRLAADLVLEALAAR